MDWRAALCLLKMGSLLAEDGRRQAKSQGLWGWTWRRTTRYKHVHARHISKTSKIRKYLINLKQRIQVIKTNRRQIRNWTIALHLRFVANQRIRSLLVDSEVLFLG